MTREELVAALEEVRAAPQPYNRLADLADEEGWTLTLSKNLQLRLTVDPEADVWIETSPLDALAPWSMDACARAVIEQFLGLLES